ncbi:MAG: complex I subunit 1 family protein [Myxococcota bacterium]
MENVAVSNSFLAAALKAGGVIFVILQIAPVMTWLERKISAFSQDRIGPNRATIPIIKNIPLVGPLLQPVVNFLGRLGLLFPLADAIKMITKEDFIPARADRFLHTLAPWVALVPAFVTFAVIPFGPDVIIGGMLHHLQVANLNVGILYIFAIASIGVYGTAFAGWASNNKFALLGALRASAQMISYEISMGLSIIGLIMVFGTVQLNEMVLKQQELLWGFIPKWGIFVQPLGFLMFFTAAYAETKRAPFDTPEGESEIVAGYFIEYSGMKFGMFYTAEFVEMIVLGGLVSTLFLGGYLIPFVPADAAIHGFIGMPGWFWALAMVFAFLFKMFVFIVLQFQIRWTLPRFRYDQIMHLGWKILLPVALANVFITGLVLVL